MCGSLHPQTTQVKMVESFIALFPPSDGTYSQCAGVPRHICRPGYRTSSVRCGLELRVGIVSFLQFLILFFRHQLIIARAAFLADIPRHHGQRGWAPKPSLHINLWRTAIIFQFPFTAPVTVGHFQHPIPDNSKACVSLRVSGIASAPDAT